MSAADSQGWPGLSGGSKGGMKVAVYTLLYRGLLPIPHLPLPHLLSPLILVIHCSEQKPSDMFAPACNQQRCPAYSHVHFCKMPNMFRDPEIPGKLSAKYFHSGRHQGFVLNLRCSEQPPSEVTPYLHQQALACFRDSADPKKAARYL